MCDCKKTTQTTTDLKSGTLTGGGTNNIENYYCPYCQPHCPYCGRQYNNGFYPNYPYGPIVLC